MRPYAALVCTLVLVLLGAALGSCSRPPAEQQIRAAIAAMQAAVEAREPRRFLDHVSTDFSGNDARVDREGLHNLLRAAVLRNERIGVTLGPIDVQVQGDRGRADMSVTLTGSAGGLIPERGAVYAVRSTQPVLVELYRIRSGLFRLLAAALFFSALVTLLLAWSISRPLEKLSRAAKRVAAGEPGVVVPVGGGGEIRELGEAFASMKERLDDGRGGSTRSRGTRPGSDHRV